MSSDRCVMNTLHSRRWFLGAVAAGALSSCVLPGQLAHAKSPKRRHRVRVVYLVSSDRRERVAFTEALRAAILELRGWYADQLGGVTFALADPIVEVVKSDKLAEWFYSNPNGANKDNWGYNNTLSEASRLVGARRGDPFNTWVIYSDGPGDKGRGGGGVAVMPEDDLLGLVGEHPRDKSVPRWIGGMGHELGHALGLPHPEDTTRDADALMWTGIYKHYPKSAYLTDEDKKQLWRSPFISTGEANKSRLLELYAHSRGSFVRREMKHQTYWIELSRQGDPVFTFEERSSAGGVYRLYDRGRGFWITIPAAGGMSRLSVDGEGWRDLYEVAATSSKVPSRTR